MSNLRTQRGPIRSAFTRAYNDLQEEIGKGEQANNRTLKILRKRLEDRFMLLERIDEEVMESMRQEQISEEDMNTEIISVMEYRDKFQDSIIIVTDMSRIDDMEDQTNNSKLDGKSRYKLPKLELTKFDGNPRSWLKFWSQFKGIHEDGNLSMEEKFQYLIQATMVKTAARSVVDSFPPTADNYPKVITYLKSRFGQDKILVEVYVRDLLKLVLNNDNDKRNIQLSTLYDQLETQLRALESLGVTSDKYAAMLYPLVESALPDEVLKTWERIRSQQGEVIGVDDPLSPLMKFLKSEVESEIRLKMAKRNMTWDDEDSEIQENKKTKKELGYATVTDLLNDGRSMVKKCIFCKKNHNSHDCVIVKNMPMEERYKKVQVTRSCFRCLKANHYAADCRNTNTCRVCGKRHHVLLCNNNLKVAVDVAVTNHSSSDVLLQTLWVVIRGPRVQREVRILIDTGSTRSYITKKAAEEFGFNSSGVRQIAHSLFGGLVTKQKKHKMYEVVASNIENTYQCNLKLLNQNKICSPIMSTPNGAWINELRCMNIELSDFNRQGEEIEILIGADIASKLYTGRIYPTKYGLVAYETFLGWTLMGQCVNEESSADKSLLVTTLHITDTTIQDLWRLDVIGIHDPTENISRKELTDSALKHFKTTVARYDDGRYEVSLPWIQGHPPVAENKEIAERRLCSALNKLQVLGKIKNYQKIFDEWVEMGVIEKVPLNEIDLKDVSYLPHHPVFNPKSSTTPIRPVFDASTRSKDKPSLNDCLEKGPNLIELIPAILMRFRMKQYGVSSDIKKAFLQISVKEEDRNFLRFLWKEENQLHVYRHCRVVFGVSSSPFLLAATLNHHLDKVPKDLFETAQLLKKSTYVDNCITSLDSQEDLNKFIMESTKLCAEAKFELRGWVWNGGEIIVGDVTGVSSSECGLVTGNIIIQDTAENISVLGLLWDKSKDTLSIDLRKIMNRQMGGITKRDILSATHQVYDPIGFCSPVTILAKLLMQDVFKGKLKWSDNVSSEIAKEFKVWWKNLSILSAIKISRWVLSPKAKNKSLHIFTDASKRAYAAVAFLRSENQEVVEIQLLMAKSRVATIKTITIPKLELVGCECGAKLAHNIKEMIDLTNTKIYYWTDSSNALSWIQRNENWQVFVYNRVKKIRELSNPNDWRHIPGHLNPADLPSRGCSASRLFKSRWWEGPDWLRHEEKYWPKSEINCDEEVVMAERKKIVISHVAQELNSVRYLRYFSQFRKIVRMIAWMKRWKSYKRAAKAKGELEQEEEDEAEYCLWHMIQREEFSSSDAIINQLNAVKDGKGLWRVKTRIIMRQDSEGFRFPIFLPKQNVAVERMIRQVHLETSHCGIQVLRSHIRERFWIVNSRITIRRVVTSCGSCRRFNARKLTAPEAPLPLNRVRDAAVFEVVGIDLGGPLYLMDGTKVWFVVFTCAVFRALHLEVISTLSTIGFVQALRRFIARRGRPLVIYTDNGTNFEGTNNLMAELNWKEIISTSTARRIKWIFNPPSAPWWGGWWERIVGMVKQLLRCNLGKAYLDFEEMRTIMCDCEQVINSRPLTYLSEDSEELIALTPMMFLTDARSHEVVDLDQIETVGFKGRYEYRQQLRQELRDRFRKEYLSLLVHHNIRKSGINTLKIGDVVIVEVENKKRVDWPLAKVIHIYPSCDGVVRSVQLRTAKGVLDRPIQRLYLLEAAIENLEEPFDPKRIMKDIKSKNEEIVEAVPMKEFATRSGRKIKIPERFTL